MLITDDAVTMSRAEYEELVDARDHAMALRDVAASVTQTIPEEEMDAYLDAATPLAYWRRRRGLTQAALAAEIGIAQPSLAQAESGRRGLAVGTLTRLARALGVRMEDLVAE